MKQYHDLIEDVLKNGVDSPDRTGVGTLSVFGRQMRFNLKEGLPLLTTRKLHWKSILIELLWLLKGSTNIAFLKKHNVTIWDEWANEQGELGPVYGKQWRDWEYSRELSTNYGIIVDGYVDSIDQIQNLIDGIKKDPHSRRHIVSAWNVGDISDMALPPCHTLFQFYVRNNTLSCQLYQRSGDVFLGIGYNIASYSALTMLIAHECGLEVGEFIHTIGDAHIYKNHIAQCKELLARSEYPLPQLKIDIPDLMSFINTVDNLSWEEIKERITLIGYQAHPTIKADVAV